MSRQMFTLGGESYGFLKPYVIAEIGVNHEGSIDRAISQVRAVARSGAHAAKFQSYTSHKIAARHNSPSYWDTKEEPTSSQFELFSKYDSFSPKDYVRLAEVCAEEGIHFMSTPFDLDIVDELDELVPSFKIASADITNVPLLRKVARTGKPVIMSTGAASLEEIRSAIAILESAHAGQVSLLHCVLNYPTPKANANLSGISNLIQEFGESLPIGYSDHVAPEADGAMPSLEQASLLGAYIIEKHFTDDRNAKGNDHYHATDEHGLKRFMSKLSDYSLMHGTGDIDLTSQNSAITNARRRIFAKQPISSGSTISEEDLIPLRANQGLEVANWDAVVGRKSTSDIAEGTPITEELIS